MDTLIKRITDTVEKYRDEYGNDESIAALKHELDVAGKEWLQNIDEHIIFDSFRPNLKNNAWILDLKDMHNIPRTFVSILEEIPFTLNDDDGEPSLVGFIDYLDDSCYESLDFDAMTDIMEKEKFDTNEMAVMTESNLDIPKNMINAYIDQTIQLRKNLPHAMASLSLWKYYSSSIDIKLIDCISTIQSIANNTFKYGRDLKNASGFFFMKIQSTYEKILKEESLTEEDEDKLTEAYNYINAIYEKMVKDAKYTVESLTNASYHDMYRDSADYSLIFDDKILDVMDDPQYSATFKTLMFIIMDHIVKIFK